MKEHPIIFSGEMVRAILAGRKTQTRRPIKTRIDGVPGDRLWVRECFYYDMIPYAFGASLKNRPKDFDESCLYYRADGECCEQIPECGCHEYPGKTPWRPSIHMPRWASRITLEVTGVRVERVQDISDDDAKAEGCVLELKDGRTIEDLGDADLWDYRLAFSELWDSINAARGLSWDANPWVWVIEFRRMMK